MLQAAWDVIEQKGADYLDSLAQRYATADAYYAIRHPSLPNYLALTGALVAGQAIARYTFVESADSATMSALHVAMPSEPR